MKQLSNKEYARYEDYKRAKSKGQILMPNTVRMVCESYNYDAEKIGRHFLEMLPKIREWEKEQMPDDSEED